jgi:uncharacterized protein DUF3562
MSTLFEAGKETVRHERAMSSLSDRTGTPLAEVRSLFAQELAELELGARVRSYLTVLTTSKVRTMLRQKSAMGPRARHSQHPQLPAARAEKSSSA